MPIASIHEARFVLFDDDTRLLFATSFDGPWDAYMEDFASRPLQLFDAIFQHVEGYEGLPDLAAVKEFILSAQVTAGAYARNYGGTVKEIRKAERVNAAFQQVLDDPDAEEALQTSGAEAAARRGCRRVIAIPDLRYHEAAEEKRCLITFRGRGLSPSRSQISRTCTRSLVPSSRAILCWC